MRTLAAPRIVRSLAAAACVLAAAGCTDAGTAPTTVDGVYTLRTIEGMSLPIEQADGSSIRSGTLDLDHGEFEMQIRLRDDEFLDDGEYEERPGNIIEFRSLAYSDSFAGAVTDNNRTMSVGYDFGDGRILRLVFKR